MGNSSSKDHHSPSRPDGVRRVSAQAPPSEQTSSPPPPPAPAERFATQIYGPAGLSSTGHARGSRRELPFLSLGRDRDRERENEQSSYDKPRETKQEREARKAEKERQARLKERERSMREESVDGGFLVTLGTYTGPEDFNKTIVRQLQVSFAGACGFEYR
jgi:hypothetical protein